METAAACFATAAKNDLAFPGSRIWLATLLDPGDRCPEAAWIGRLTTAGKSDTCFSVS